jgi:carbamoylphosphate synthase large subunit
MAYRIVPYSRKSGGAKLLAEKLSEITGEKVLAAEPNYDDTCILWGSSKYEMKTLQPTDAINIAKNKLRTFEKLKEANISIPDFTTDKTLAEGWIFSGITVLARTLLNAAEGRGIVVCSNLPLPPAPLYVKLIKKMKEFRVHVVAGEVIDLQEKRRRNGVRQDDGNRIDGTIRNIGNDWVFCRNNIVEPAGLRQLGVDAVKACGLLFGAVDIIWNRRRNQLYVLEINTSPGLCPSTATSYATAFAKLPKR